MDGLFDIPGLDHDSPGPGSWQRKRPGGPMVWVPDEPDPRPHVADVALQIVEGLRGERQRGRAWRFVGGLCDCCGCAVLEGEPCPSCLAWAERDAVRQSWASPVVRDMVWAGNSRH